MKKKEAHLYEITSFTPYGHLLGVFFFFFFFFSSCGQFDHVIYLMVLLESAGVVGFAGKAPFSPEWTKQNKSHAQELAK